MVRSMQRVAAALAIVSLGACASAPPTSALQTPGSTPPPATAKATSGAVDSPELLRRYAERLPAGSTVKIVFTTGKRLTGTLMGVENTLLVVKPKARIPEPARAIPLAEIADIDVTSSGSNVLKAAAVGAGVGAATFFTFLLILIAHSD